MNNVYKTNVFCLMVGLGMLTCRPASATTMAPAPFPTSTANQSGCASVNYYDVGPDGSGKPYNAISKVPWSKLKGCDTVRIFAKLGGQPYNEMILLSAGSNLTPTAPDRFMRVVGVSDPVTGAPPVIDGSNATQLETLPGANVPRPLQYWDRTSSPPTLYQLGLVTVSRQAGSDYDQGPAGYIAIENLDIRNGRYGQTFHYAETGTTSTYSAFTSCLNIEAGSHVVVANNVLHNCGNGLFVNSKNHVAQELSQDIFVRGNFIFDSSNPTDPTGSGSGGYSEHNSYSEARGIVFEHNYFGNVKPSAHGDCLKDRSSGLIVRYNTFASTCGIQLHLVDSTGGEQLIYDQPDYAQTFVYGNVFDITDVSGGVPLLTKYGGDSGQLAHYRSGTLFFYNNTFAVKANASSSGAYATVLLFKLSVQSAIADVRNNVFYTTPASAGSAGAIQAVTVDQGTVNLTNNWFSPNAAPYWLDHPSSGVVTGWATNVNVGGSILPGFANYSQHNFSLSASSGLINKGVTLSGPIVSTNHLPVEEPGLVVTARPINGQIDVGAFEYIFVDSIFANGFQ